MATTSRPITELALGIRTTAGAVVASGKARAYNVGTLVAATVYSDAACTTPYAQPVTLNAGGQATVYTLEAIRLIVKDSTETTTYYDGNVNLNRHDSLYITHADFNGGAETTLENLLTDMASSIGDDFEFYESATATGIPYTTYLGAFCVSVKSYGALGDDSNDDTAEIQAAIDRVEARGGGWVFFPLGVYKISSALVIDSAGVRLFGVGHNDSIIKNYSTTANTITVNPGSAVDSQFVIKDLTLAASTTTSGTALVVTNGFLPLIRDVEIYYHRTGIDTSAVAGARIENVTLNATDDNAAAIGITSGPFGQVIGCAVVSATVNGTGIVLGDDARCEDCRVTKFTTGALLSGARAQISGGYFAGGQVTAVSATGASTVVARCYANLPTTGVSLAGTYSTVTGTRVVGATTGIALGATGAHADTCVLGACTTGVSLAAADTRCSNTRFDTCVTGASLGAARTHCDDCFATGATTGFTVGAFASCSVMGCAGTSNTLDLSVNASATLFRESNQFTTYTSTGATPFGLPTRLRHVVTTNSVIGPATWAPIADPTVLNVFYNTYNGGALSVGITAPSTTNSQPGDLMHLHIQADASGTTTVTGGTISIKDMNGVAITTAAAATADTAMYLALMWTGTEWRQFLRVLSVT
jgi:hypothetical protein